MAIPSGLLLFHQSKTISVKMKNSRYQGFNILAILLPLFFSACIGNDFVFDEVRESLRISTKLDSLGIGASFQFEAIYTNAVGIEETPSMDWSGSDPSLLEIDANGLATGLERGAVQVFVSVETEAGTLRDSVAFVIGDSTAIAEPEVRNGSLITTSSYVLEGDFQLEVAGNNLLLSLSENYKASSSLPGLYLYLTNNPNSIAGAHEVMMVDVFDGAHSYLISGDDVSLDQYSHVLYYCKPFGVKVGEGSFEN